MEITAKVIDIQFDLNICLQIIKKHELITDKLVCLFTTRVVPIHADLRNQVIAKSLTHRTDPNSILASLIKIECLEVDNNHPSSIGRIQLV